MQARNLSFAVHSKLVRCAFNENAGAFPRDG